MTRVTAATRWACVIGDPVEHSASPALHNAAFAALGLDAVFLALRVAPAALAAAVDGLRALRPLGVSVTVPHKPAVAALVDDLAPPADRIGAVNCLELSPDGRLIGHNTDAGGYVDGLADGLGLTVAGLRAVVLGTGGAARAVVAGLEDAGAGAIDVVARAPARVEWTQAQPWTAETLVALARRADLVVDCTSAGLSAAAEATVPAPFPLAELPAAAVVTSLVYHRTPALLTAARERGLRTLDGGLMLVHQGARALRLWTGREPPVAAMRAALPPAG